MGIGTSGGCMREKRKQAQKRGKASRRERERVRDKRFLKKKIMFDSLLVARHCTLSNLLGYFGEFAA